MCGRAEFEIKLNPDMCLTRQHHPNFPRIEPKQDLNISDFFTYLINILNTYYESDTELSFGNKEMKK